MKTSALSRTLVAHKIRLWTACALVLCTSAAAQVTPLWTYENTQTATEFPTYGVRDATRNAAGDVIVVGHRYTQGPLIAPGPVLPFTILFHPDGSSWTQGSTGPDDLSAFGVTVSPIDGSIFTAEDNYSQHKISVTKRTSAGAFVWRTASVPLMQSTTSGCVLDAAGNTYVTSTTDDPPVMVLTSWDSAGALRYSIPLAAQYPAGMHSIVLDPAGDLIIAANGPPTVVKVSRAGVVQWSHAVSPGFAMTDLACDATGGFYTLTPGHLLQQFDANGAPGWSVPASNVAVMAVDKQQCVVLANIATNSVVTRRYDPVGNLLWQRSLPFAGYPNIFPAGIDIDAAGDSLVDAMVELPGYRARDAAYFSYTPSGDLRWSGVVSSGGGRLSPTAMIALPDGAFAIPAMNASPIGFAPRIFVTELRPQSIGFCFGDGSGAACPCSNDSSQGEQRGCTNSTGVGARIVDAGIASVTNDSLVLASSGETSAGGTVIFQGTASVTSTAFGDGLRCVGGSIRRLYTQIANSGVVSVPQPGDASISARSAAAGDVLSAGSQRHYQAWYRDASPSFCPTPVGSTWNLSSGLSVTWAP